MLKMRVAKDSELWNLLNLLTKNNYRELTSNLIWHKESTRIFVSKQGTVATIKERNGIYTLTFRDTAPGVKSRTSVRDKLEYKVCIDKVTHSVHKLVALTYPEYAGVHKEGYEVHHIDGNHLNNNCKNLIWLSSEAHKKVHELIAKGVDKNEALATVCIIYGIYNWEGIIMSGGNYNAMSGVNYDYKEWRELECSLKI